MRGITLAMLAATVVGFGTQLSSAADLPLKAAPYVAPPVLTWTGWYVGGHVGAGWGTTEASWTGATVNGVPQGVGAFPIASDSHTVNGFLGGVQAGYNWQTANWVFGVEGDFSWSGIDGTSPCVISLNNTPAGTCSSKVRWMADITGRVGFTVDRALIYLKGGAAWADTEYRVTAPVFFNGGATSSSKETRFGGLLGVGIEYAVSRNLSAKVEYNYIDFGKDSVTLAGAIRETPVSASYDVNQVLHVVKGGVNYRF